MIRIIGFLFFLSGVLILPLNPPQTTIWRWSDVETWKGHGVPRVGADFEIPANRTVLLDVSPPDLGHGNIAGRLIAANTNLELRIKSITVTGSFQIGSSLKPFKHRFLLQFLGLNPNTDQQIQVTSGGKLEWFGAQNKLMWTHLAQNAAAGTSLLTLAQSPNWHSGDELIVASSDFNANHAERVSILEIKGRRLKLSKPLRYIHRSEANFGVLEQAEVGLLTQHIMVRGNPETRAQEIGGQILMMSKSTAHISGVQFLQMGQVGKIGRYPIHFHMVGNANGSYLRGVSLEQSFNRCVTIHATNQVLIQDVVAYNTIGHCFFLEDGVESKNQFLHNLGIWTRIPKPGKETLVSDARAATFWISNPNNTLIGNVAAGSEYHGFWFALPKKPTGSSAGIRLHPRQEPLGRFESNLAHSNAHTGLYVDDDPNPPGINEAPNYAPRETAVFQAFTAYKNRRRGIWLRGINLEINQAKLADNAIGATLAASKSRIVNSVFVGQSQAVFEPPKADAPGTPIIGFEFYDGQVSVQNSSFYEFKPSKARKAAAFTALRFSPFFLDPENFVQGIQLHHAQAVLFEPRAEPLNPKFASDGYNSSVFTDLDGSLTGLAGHKITIRNKLLYHSGCETRLDWMAYICNSAFGRLFTDVQDIYLKKQPQPRTVRINNPVTRASMRLYGIPETGENKSFQTNLPTNQTYRLEISQPVKHVRLSWRAKEALELEIPFTTQLEFHTDSQRKRQLFETRVVNPEQISYWKDQRFIHLHLPANTTVFLKF